MKKGIKRKIYNLNSELYKVTGIQRVLLDIHEALKTGLETKIVGTIGPASEHRLPELFEAGLNVCRINYSHGSWDEQSEKTEEVIRLRKELDLPIAMILDMQGPEIRTGMLVTGKNEKIPLEDGQKFVLVNEDIIGDKERVSVSYKGLYNDVKPGAKI